jgi:D-lactate dehydrogenase (cytochrome)
MVAVKSVEDAINLLQNTKIAFRDNVSAFEFMSDTCIQAIEKYLNHMKLPLGSNHSWQIIFEIINQEEQDIINFLENHMESGQIIDGLIANSEKEKNEIWLVRHSISEAEKLSGNGIHHDISIPIKRIPEFLKMAKPAMKKIVGSSIVYTFGHLGDGNLHFTKTQPETMSESDFLDKTHEINRSVHDTAETLGGSFSAEHGIGSKLMDDLVHFSDPVKIQLMQTIKKSVDPKNIMNPNKLIKI